MTETPHGSTCPSCGSGEPDTFIRNGSPYGLTKYERRPGTKRPCMDPWHDLAPSPPDSPDTQSEERCDDRLCGECGAYISETDYPPCHDPIHLQALVDRYRDALNYIAGYDVAGYDAHMPPALVAEAALNFRSPSEEA